MKVLGGTILVLSLVGCYATGGVGDPCEDLEVPPTNTSEIDGGLATSQGFDIVEKDTSFPCDGVICIATVGRGGYCSRECVSNDDCPNGFECAIATSLGPFANQTFCVWTRCEQDTDCGDPWLFQCETVPELSLAGEVKLCGLRPR